MNGDGVQVRWFGDGDTLTPWAMLHDLPDGTLVRYIVGAGEHVANCSFNNRPVMVVAWPDGTTPQPPTIDVQWWVVDRHGDGVESDTEDHAKATAAAMDRSWPNDAPHRVERREVHR